MIRKLNNFRTTAIIAAIISGVAALYALGSFFLFHYAGDLVEGEMYIRQVGFYNYEIGEKNVGGILSFVVFLSIIVTLICGIVVAYSMFPFIKNKEKLTPKKSVLLFGFVGGIFNLILVGLMILLISTKPLTSVGLIITLPFGILSTIGSLLYLLPYLRCNFFMPAVNKQ